MPPRSTGPEAMSVGTAVLVGLAGLTYLASLLLLADLGSSDAAGNGLTRDAAIVALAIEWLLLAGLAVKEQRLAGLALAALGALAGVLALRLQGDGFYRARWPLLLAAAGPVLVAVFAARRVAAPPALGAAAALVAIGLATAAYRAAYRERDRAADAAAWERAEQEELERLGPGTPVAEWLQHAVRADRRPAVLAGIRRSPTRQAEVEALLGGGFAVLLRDLPELDLEPTERLCAAASRALGDVVARMGPGPGGGPAFLADRSEIQDYRGALRWLVEGGCDVRADLDRLTAAVARYEDTPVRRELEAFLAGLRATGPRSEPPR